MYQNMSQSNQLKRTKQLGGEFRTNIENCEIIKNFVDELINIIM